MAARLIFKDYLSKANWRAVQQVENPACHGELSF